MAASDAHGLDLRGATGDLRSQLPRPAAATEPPDHELRAILRGGARTGRRRPATGVSQAAGFDGVELDELRIPQVELDAALASIPPLFREALEARGNILAFHRDQLPQEGRHERDGIVVRALHRPVDRAGSTCRAGRPPMLRPCS